MVQENNSVSVRSLLVIESLAAEEGKHDASVACFASGNEDTEQGQGTWPSDMARQ